MCVFDRPDDPAAPAATQVAEHHSTPARPTPGGAAAQSSRSDSDLLGPLLGLVGAAELSLVDVLRHLTDQTAEQLPAADAVLVTVRRRDGRREVVATDERGQAAHELQLGLREGPALDALTAGQVVVSGDLGTDPRWPRLAGAIGTLEVRSALCVPLLLDGTPAGTLTAYAGDVDAFDDRATHQASCLAGPAGGAVRDALILEQSRRLAVDLHLQGRDRRAVEEAVAVLVAEGAGPEEALAVLQMLGRTDEADLAAAARAVLAARTSGLTAPRPGSAET